MHAPCCSNTFARLISLEQHASHATPMDVPDHEWHQIGPCLGDRWRCGRLGEDVMATGMRLNPVVDDAPVDMPEDQ
eukprot:7854302-Pyramimonas_sp.AAC.1